MSHKFYLAFPYDLQSFYNRSALYNIFSINFNNYKAHISEFKQIF